MTALLAAGAVILGGALASATGFGFSLVSAPLLFILVGPVPAIGLLAFLGLEVNLLTLATEGRRPQPALRETAVLLACSVPGAIAGVLVLRSLDAVWLQVALSVTVVATLIARGRSVHGSRGRGAPLAGFAAGALTTATSAAGPPLLIHLLGRGYEPGQVRDTVTLCFVGLAPVGIAALLVTGTSAAFDRMDLLLPLIPAVAVGQIVGRRGFHKLAAGGAYEPVLTGVLLLSVAAGLVGAFVSG